MHYFWPNEPMLQFIIWIMVALAIFVTWRMYVIASISKRNIKALELMRDVKYLENTLLYNDVNPEAAFEQYMASFETLHIDEPIKEHLKSIYFAGQKSSRLNAELLVQNTIDKVFTKIDALKTGISLFLVFGILGTLFGLAGSIGSFAMVDFTPQNGAMRAGEITTLFKHLKGAFAPSMWGIGFTVTFILWYSIKIQEGAINKLTEVLTENTIRYWIPVLYPTDFQRGDNSIVKLNATIKNAEGINRGVTELQDNLKESNKTVKSLKEMADAIDKSTERFEASTKTVFKLKTLFNQLKAANEEYKENLQAVINADIDERKKSLDIVSNSVKDQKLYITNVLKEIETYNANFSKTSGELLQEIHTATNSFTASQETNTEVAKVLSQYAEEIINRQDKMIKEITHPINQHLEEMNAHLESNLNTIKEELGKNLEKMAINLQALENPLNKTSKTIEVLTSDAAAAFKRSTAELAKLTNKIIDHRENYGKDDPVADILKEQKDTLTELNSTFDKMNANIEILIETNPNANKKDIERRRKEKLAGLGNKKQAGYITLLQQNAMPLLIAVILIFSMFTQMMMVSRLGTIEEQQQQIMQMQTDVMKEAKDMSAETKKLIEKEDKKEVPPAPANGEQQ